MLRKELEDMAQRRPGQIELLFVLDKASKDFKGETGYVTQEMLAKHLPPAGLADQTKVSGCWLASLVPRVLNSVLTAAVATPHPPSDLCVRSSTSSGQRCWTEGWHEARCTEGHLG